ncbi:hypothetical protein [Halalkalicoccus jeotgali]|uniref:C2H2-type domain-containing protein n=1 Tax=Halalkalicoccus jeotgali (strain DSM 18796 / CECT 7217 / JCM 14584 / KCTC 4019 / B3) TaxID=795797 RepID=D8J429_HALJB|nr:hypothetical protein [Halalkalicoccus jeotgali]ADJ15421.1 hypothetical protein HacjB3_10190 [Halalkalicoccus jeotgali B3]ELY35803.1 hypothetical protein C497_12481 [Halalkalicoccus jeotgali B3]
MYECDRCGKRFLTARAEHGHRSMCPENPERTVSERWAGPVHGRWGSDEQ